MIVADDRGRVRSFNAAAQRMVQVDAQQMVGQPISLPMPSPHRGAHDHYDGVLVAVARRLRHGLAERDFVARLGGDEFTVLLPDVGDRAQACAVAERLRKSLTRPIVVPGGRVAVGASFGVAIWQDDGHDDDALLDEVDRKTYLDKTARRGDARASPDGDD